MLFKRGPKKDKKELVITEKVSPAATAKHPGRKTASEMGLVPVDVNALMEAAVKQGSGIETLERLVALRLQLEQEVARKAYFTALAAFQRDCPIIPKTRIVWNKDRYDKNGDLLPRTVRYKYAPMEVIVENIKEPLSRNGLSYTVDVKQAEKDVTSIFEGHHIDGHKETTPVIVPIMYSDRMNAAQSILSAITYSTRRALCNGLGIVTADEDDDGNATGPIPADQPPETKGGKKPPKAKAPPAAPKERDVTPPPPDPAERPPAAVPVGKPTELPPEGTPEEVPPQHTAAEILSIGERCKAGVKMLQSIKVFTEDDLAKNTDSIDDMMAAGEYDKLVENYHQLISVWNDAPKGKKEKKK